MEIERVGAGSAARRRHRCVSAPIGALIACCVLLAGCGGSERTTTTTDAPVLSVVGLIPPGALEAALYIDAVQGNYANLGYAFCEGLVDDAAIDSWHSRLSGLAPSVLSLTVNDSASDYYGLVVVVRVTLDNEGFGATLHFEEVPNSNKVCITAIDVSDPTITPYVSPLATA